MKMNNKLLLLLIFIIYISISICETTLDEILSEATDRLKFKMKSKLTGEIMNQFPDMTFHEPFFQRETKDWDEQVKKHPKRGYGANWIRYYGINPTDAEVWKRYYESLEWAPRIHVMRYLGRQDMGQISKLTKYLRNASKEQRDKLTEFLMETRDHGARFVEGQDQIDYFLNNQEKENLKPWKPEPPRMVLGQIPGIKVVPVFLQEDKLDKRHKSWSD